MTEEERCADADRARLRRGDGVSVGEGGVEIMEHVSNTASESS